MGGGWILAVVELTSLWGTNMIRITETYMEVLWSYGFTLNFLNSEEDTKSYSLGKYHHLYFELVAI